jgi:hypothetical protein
MELVKAVKLALEREMELIGPSLRGRGAGVGRNAEAKLVCYPLRRFVWKVQQRHKKQFLC